MPKLKTQTKISNLILWQIDKKTEIGCLAIGNVFDI